MADYLIQVTLSNLVVATFLAVIAWAVQRRVRSASLANLLWALVLIKMVTPPLFSIPILEVPSVSSFSVHQNELSNEQPAPPTNLGATESIGNSMIPDEPGVLTSDGAGQSSADENRARFVSLAFGLWISISALLLSVSAFRIIRFHWLLKANSLVDHELSTGLSADVASQLDLRSHPNIVITTANIAPFVWWMAGRSVIVASKQATQKLSAKDLRLVITHEMAHIKRRDHWFRWLEWIALIGLWWNPVMWWARNQLRISEEMACDDLVLETTGPDVHQYANSLLNVAELLASTAIRPPVVASAINSGGDLEKRLKMMIAKKSCKVSSKLRLIIVAIAICVFPLGVVYAQDVESVEKRLGGAVEAGEITLEQANLMMDALRRSSTDRQVDDKKQRYVEIAREIYDAVKAEKMSNQDADKKLIAILREMFGGTSDDRTDREMEENKRRYVEFAREIEGAVKAEKLSKQDAEKKLIAMRREMFGDKPAGRTDREMEEKKQRYMEFAREIEGAVKAEKLSKQDAEKKLIAMRREMFGDTSADRKDREMENKKRRYMEFAREIEGAVKAGKLSKQDAEKKLIAMRREMFGDTSADRKDREMENKKRRYMDAVNKIEAAMKAGEVSKEEAETRLREMRKMIRGEEPEGDDNRSRKPPERDRR